MIVTRFRGDIGEATICQVRQATNPMGESWVVTLTPASCPTQIVYDGPSYEEAQAAYDKACDETRSW
jgi:hypothetical protein